MSEFWAFLQIGFHHIVAWDAADHILFLLALAAIYRGRDWRAALMVISAFTIGHSITLLLAVTDVLVLPTRLVEFLIPVTIVAILIPSFVFLFFSWPIVKEIPLTRVPAKLPVAMAVIIVLSIACDNPKSQILLPEIKGLRCKNCI